MPDDQIAKTRPALVLFAAGRDSLVLCPITTQGWDEDVPRIKITAGNFSQGSLNVEPSFVEPALLFSFRNADIRYRIAQLHPVKFGEVQAAIKQFIDDGVAKGK